MGRCRTLIAWGAALVVCLALAGCTGAETRKQRHLAEGNKLAEQGQYGEAIVEYRNAIKIDERFGEARLKLADTYAKNGDSRNAYREYIRAADLLPDNVDAQLKAGTYLLLAGKFEDARARADRALAINANSIDAMVLRANASAGLKDLDGAVQQIGDAIKLDPKQATPYSSLGALEMARGRRDEAEAAFKKAVEAAPQSASAHLALANFYWSSGRQADAEGAFKAALQLEPKNALANRALATFYIASGRVPEAEPLLRTLADSTPDAGARIALADYYLLAGRPTDAERELLTAESLKGGYVPARSRLAAVWFAGGRKSEAYAAIDDAMKKDPKNAQAMLVKARLLFADGKLDESLALANEAKTLDANLGEAFYLAGTVHARKNETDEAIADFTEVLRLNPRATAAQLQISELELRRGGAKAALEAARNAVSMSNGSPVARLLLARTQMASGDLPSAEAGMSKLLAEFPNAAPVQAQSGTLALVKRDFNSARLAFARALELDPGYYEAVAGLVTADLAQGKPNDAKARIEQRLKQKPNDANLLMLGARVFGAERDYAKCEELLRRAIDADPLAMQAYGMLGQLYLSQRRTDEALKEFDAIATRQPRNIPAHTMVAMLLEAQGKIPEAQKRYEHIVTLSPRAAVASNNLAWIYAAQGQNLDTALSLAQAAKAELPEIAEVDDTLGYVYYKRELYTLAIPSYEAAVQRVPANPDYQFRLGMAYVKAGEWEKGKRALSEALRLKPDFSGADEARKALAQIGG